MKNILEMKKIKLQTYKIIQEMKLDNSVATAIVRSFDLKMTLFLI